GPVGTPTQPRSDAPPLSVQLAQPTARENRLAISLRLPLARGRKATGGRRWGFWERASSAATERRGSHPLCPFGAFPPGRGQCNTRSMNRPLTGEGWRRLQGNHCQRGVRWPERTPVIDTPRLNVVAPCTIDQGPTAAMFNRGGGPKTPSPSIR